MASPKGSWRPIAALLDWAFANGSAVTPIGELVKPGKATVPAPPTAEPTLAAGAHPQLSSTTTSVGQSGLPLWAVVAGVGSVLALLVAGALRRVSRKRS
jgi:D-alanyl-D-alanine carboxypeptidase (penicillin-binding protein 5/6)